MSIKNILFPTDFSPAFSNALFYATHMAELLKANIVLMHSYDFSDEYSAVPAEQIVSMQSSIRQEAEANMQKLIRQATEISSVTHFTYDLELGFFTEYISKVICKKKIDLIALGTHGAEGLESLLFGTNTAKVIEAADRPVLVIPEALTFSPIKEILFLSQYKPDDIPRLKYVAEIAKAFDASIHIVHITGDPAEQPDTGFVESVKQSIDYSQIQFRCVEGRDILRCVTEFAEKENIDWIVMSISHRNAFTRLFGRNLTKEMSYKTKVPLFVFPEQVDTQGL